MNCLILQKSKKTRQDAGVYPQKRDFLRERMEHADRPLDLRVAHVQTKQCFMTGG